MSYVIIGNSAAAVGAVEAIRSVDESGPIALYCDDRNPIYSRCMLSYYLAGRVEEQDLRFRDEDWYEQMKVDAHPGVAATAVDPEAKEVHLAGGGRASYDKLLIATGGRARALGRPGAELPGVFCLRDLEDAKQMLARVHAAKRAVVLGGGLVGLKAAYGLRERGMEVSVLVRSPHLMSQVVDAKAGELIRGRLEEHGIEVRTGVDAKAVTGDGGVKAVEVSEGEPLACEIVVVGKGVDSNIGVVAESGIETHWGIITDEHMQTSARDVYAAGDVAETEDLLTRERTVHAIWPNASEQGRVAGFNMAGQERSYPGSLAMNAVDFYGTPVMAVGNVRPREEGFEEVVDYRPERGLYRKMVLREGKLAGLLVVGEMRGTGAALALIKAGVPVEEIRELIMSEEFDYAKIVRLVKAYPEAFGEREFRLTVRSGAGG